MSQNVKQGLRSWQERETVLEPPQPRQTSVTETTTSEATAKQPRKSGSLQEALDALTSALMQGDISTVTLPTKYFQANTTVIIGQLVNTVNQVFIQKTPNRKATISTPASNTGTVYIGNQKVNATQYGLALPPNSVTPYITVDDLSKIYYLDVTSGDMFTVTWEWGVGAISSG